MNKPKFSVAVIARNEALTLPKLVGSLKEFQERGGEICVLDTGSTDDTVEVAKSLGCKVEAVGDKFKITVDEELAKNINEKFIVDGEEYILKADDVLFNFGEARNYAANLSSSEVIAMPDCDEVYTKLDLDKVDKAIEDGFEQLEYNFVFSHDHLGNPVIKFKHCKFYDRRVMKWRGIIHEILGGPARRTFLGEDVIKLEHYQNQLTNRSGYLRGLAIDCYNHPESDRNSHYLARELFYLGRHKSAIKEFKRHITLGGWGTEAAQSMLYIGDCYKALGDTGKMLKWYSMSVEKEARREPLMRMAEFYVSKGMHQHVVAYGEAALTITQLPFYSNHQPYYEHAPHEMLYIAYWYLGNKEKSKEHWEKAIEFVPHSPKYLSDAKFYNIPSAIDTYTKKIKDGVNFVFVKRGDGELACMSGKEGKNCDKHNYSPELAEALRESFEFLKDKADIVEWKNQLIYNTFLHRKDSDLGKLKLFWMTVRDSSRRKVFVGPERLRKVSKLLDAEFIPVPLVNAFDSIDSIDLRPDDNDIYIFSCGMPAKVLIASLIKQNPNVTCVDAGSSFDPIFIGNTRTEQATQEDLQNLYFNSYDDPQIDGMVSYAELNWLYRTSKAVDSFLEIGSYKGKSTHAILSSGCKEVYAVDHFVGSSDPVETGNLDTYEEFRKNVRGFSNLTIHRMSSLEAVSKFEDKSLDVVFIDGGHKIQEITEDIVAWLPKAKKIICGHDYNDVKAVKLAVDTLLGPVQVCDRIWWKELDGTEVLDIEKANKLARYLDKELVSKMFKIPKETHPERTYCIENVEGDVVYDLGCGNFKTLDSFIGVDAKPGADIRASIDNLPMIETGSVDTIVSCHSLEHMIDTRKTLIEWRRVLKIGGKMVLVLPDDEFINTLDPLLSGGQHLQAFTRDSLVDIINDIPGLLVEKVETVVDNWSFGVVVGRYKVEEPKISFVIPTLGREEGLKRCVDSIKNLNYPQDKIEIIVKQDVFDENRVGVPKLVKQGVEEASGEWIVFASNDIEFTPESINEALLVGDLGYVAFNTGAISQDEGNINEHFMIRKDIVEKIGEVFDTDFYHCGVDNLLWAKMKKLSIAVRCDRALVTHFHFTKGAAMDAVYELGWDKIKVKEDRELLIKKLKEL